MKCWEESFEIGRNTGRCLELIRQNDKMLGGVWSTQDEMMGGAWGRLDKILGGVF